MTTQYPVSNTDGTKDKRYSVAPEFCGHAEKRLVLRFCGEFIDSFRNLPDATLRAVGHKNSASVIVAQPVKTQNLETNNYHLAHGTGAGKGTYIIIRKRDNFTTLRNTGSEAQAEYKKFQRAYNISGASFDELCSLETFTE